MSSKDSDVEAQWDDIEEIWEKYGNGKNPATEGRVEGTVDNKYLLSDANSFVVNNGQHGTSIIFIFKSKHSDFNLEIPESALKLSTYTLQMSKREYLNTKPSVAEARWWADTTRLSNATFDSVTGKYECDVDATVYRGNPQNPETAKLKAHLFIVQVK